MSWKIRRDDERYYLDANTMPGAQKANRLAAAAPELLEALEFFVAAGGGAIYRVEGEELQDCVDKARAAIAKAKGEE